MNKKLTAAQRRQINAEQTTLITLNSLIEMAVSRLGAVPAFGKNWKPEDYDAVGEVFKFLKAARENKEFQAVIKKARRRQPLVTPK